MLDEFRMFKVTSNGGSKGENCEKREISENVTHSLHSIPILPRLKNAFDS